MNIFPAIDLYNKKAVRLEKGDYSKMTIYSDDPVKVAADFTACGCGFIHIVDLEGAKESRAANFDTICEIKKTSGLFCEVGGGIRNMDIVDKYFDEGIDRVILGTAAVNNTGFLEDALSKYNEKIAVGADIKDGFIAIKGWLEKSSVNVYDFLRKMQELGVKTVIVTDISKDGMMSGTNRTLYRELAGKFDINITASGGISTLEDIKELNAMGLYGAIIGKAYYTDAIDLKEALKIC